MHKHENGLDPFLLLLLLLFLDTQKFLWLLWNKNISFINCVQIQPMFRVFYVVCPI